MTTHVRVTIDIGEKRFGISQEISNAAHGEQFARQASQAVEKVIAGQFQIIAPVEKRTEERGFGDRVIHTYPTEDFLGRPLTND